MGRARSAETVQQNNGIACWQESRWQARAALGLPAGVFCETPNQPCRISGPIPPASSLEVLQAEQRFAPGKGGGVRCNLRNCSLWGAAARSAANLFVGII